MNVRSGGFIVITWRILYSEKLFKSDWMFKRSKDFVSDCWCSAGCITQQNEEEFLQANSGSPRQKCLVSRTPDADEHYRVNVSDYVPRMIFSKENKDKNPHQCVEGTFFSSGVKPSISS